MRGLRVRRGVVALAGVGLFLGVGLAAPAAAADLPISGSYAGGGTLVNEPCTVPGSPIGAIGASFDGTGDLTSLGQTQVAGVVCLDPTAFPRAFGPLTLTTPDGSITATMEGSNVSVNPPIGGPYDFELVATVTGGTGDFEGATGTLQVHATVVLSPYSVTGTIDGTVTIPSPTPSSRDDCRNGGWRDVVDENGNPFANQGQCIAWVNHHT